MNMQAKRHRRISFRPAPGPSGFTLLELMISIVLLAVIMVIVSGALRLGYRSVERGEKKAESLERLKTSLMIIDAQIQSAMSLTSTNEGETENYFQGTRATLKLPTNYSIWGGYKGYVIVEYRVEPDSTGKQVLQASETTIGMTQVRQARLLEGFRDIHFEYFYKEPGEEDGSWVEEWPDTTGMPQKVRVHLLYGRQKVVLTIPIRAVRPMV
jgi:general secretion pathway protein J